jgi:hypothetical protein
VGEKPSRAWRSVTPVTIAAAGVTLAAMLWHVTHYFFTFDDFVLVREAATHDTPQIFRSVLLSGFYRPLGYVFLRAVYLASGWQPQVFAALAIALHAAVTIIVYVIAIRMGLSRRASTIASVLFFMSAPAAESYFWPSAVFDRLSTLAMLGGVLVALWTARTDAPRRWLAPGLGMLTLALAVLSKEIGFVLPALAICAVIAAGSFRRGPLVEYVLALTAGAAVALILREQALPNLAGPYGSWTDLIRGTAVFRNLRADALATVMVPLPAGPVWYPDGRVVSLFAAALVVTWIVLATRALASNHVRHLFLIGAWLVSVAPVLWTPMIPGSSAAGRFLYLPGVWLALLVGSVSDRIDRSAWRSAIGAAAVGALVVLHAVSVWYQARIWRVASEISRAAVGQLEPYRGETTPLFIDNLPYWYAQGPYVVKEDAFAAYYGGEFRPVIRARRRVVTFMEGRTYWLGTASVRGLADETARPGDRVVSLQLPILSPITKTESSILAPAPDSRLKPPIRVTGWALDRVSSVGCGVDRIHVYLTRMEPGAQPQFAGAAAVDEAVPELHQGKRQFWRCGWSLTLAAVAPGTYTLTAFPRSLSSGEFAQATVIPIHVLPPGRAVE